MATIGLQVLDDLQNNRLVDAAARQQDIALLKSAEKPQAVLLLVVAPSVERLTQATNSVMETTDSSYSGRLQSAALLVVAPRTS